MPALSARHIVIAMLLAAAAGCSTPPPRPTYQDIRFTAAPPIELDVARVEVQTTYQAPFKAPNIEHLFPVPPARAMENWAHDRLKPVGSAGRAVFTIRNASVVQTELKTSEGIRGALTTEPGERDDLTLEASVQVIDQSGLQARTASVRVVRSQSLMENITPNDRDRAWYDLTKAAMADFNAQMETEIRNNFGNSVVK